MLDKIDKYFYYIAIKKLVKSIYFDCTAMKILKKN